MLVNFDFDGVIADTFDHLFGVCAAAQAELGCGRPPVADDLRLVENLTFAGVGTRLGIPATELPRYEEIGFAMQRQQVPGVKLFHGMKGLLLEVYRLADIAIITAGDTRVVHGYLQDHGIDTIVATVSGGEHRRSKSASLVDNMASFSSPPDQTWMVGDAVSDIRQGRLAGVGTIGVSWGFQARTLLERESPDYLADSPQELLGILQRL